MLYPNIEECVKVVGSKYALAIVAAKLGKDILKTQPAIFEGSSSKELTMALREIVRGKVTTTFNQ